MGYETLKQSLRGVAFTTPVPFTEDGAEVRYVDYKKNIEAIERAGGGLFVPCGNTGEYYSLTNNERINIVEAAAEAISEKNCIIGGAGGSTKTVQKLSNAYADLDVDGVMIMHPRHTYLHEQGVEQYYREIANATDLGIILYKRGPELSDGVIASLSTIENIVGVKYAVNDITGFSQLVDRVGDDFVCVNGIAERFAPTFALEGAEGFTTGIGNFVPETSLALHEAIVEEDWNRARHLRDLVRPYENLREETGKNSSFRAANNVPAVKYGMDLAGLEGGVVREPLVDLSESDKKRAEKYYSQITDSDHI